MVADNPGIEIRVGTDSQKRKRKIVYVTIIAFRFGIRGVHYIYHKELIKKKKYQLGRKPNEYERLYNEAVLSLEVANHLNENGLKVDFVELDYNSDHKYLSNQLIGPTVGMCKAYGFQVKVKPDEQMAVKAADNLAKK